jgi:hypothetical protein
MTKDIWQAKSAVDSQQLIIQQECCSCSLLWQRSRKGSIKRRLTSYLTFLHLKNESFVPEIEVQCGYVAVNSNEGARGDRQLLYIAKSSAPVEHDVHNLLGSSLYSILRIRIQTVCHHSHLFLRYGEV